MTKKLTFVRSMLVASAAALSILAGPSSLTASAQNAPPPGGAGGAGGPGGGAAGGAGGSGGAGGAPDPQQFVDRLMANDANADGRLAKDEIPGGFADRLFESGDVNKDGFLTPDELKTIGGRFGPGGAGGAGGPGGAGGRGGQGGGAQLLSFGAYMGMANRNVRTLSRSAFDDASREADIAAVNGVQMALVGAKSRIATVEMAPQAKQKYGSDEAAFRRDLRAGLMAALMAAINLDDAIAAGDAMEAKAALAILIEAEEAGHTAFQPPPPPRGQGGGPGGQGGRGGGQGGGQGGQGGQGGAGGNGGG